MKKLISAIFLMAFLLAESGGSTTPFTATAYCLRGKTASGHMAAKGMVAADLHIFPLGTHLAIQAGEFSGNYIVRDSGSKIKGRRIDIWMSSKSQAIRFGKRRVLVQVITYEDNITKRS